MADRTIACTSEPWKIAFADGGKTIHALCEDNTIRIWDFASGKLLREKKVSARSALLNAGVWAERDEAKSTQLWDLTAERRIQIFQGGAVNRGALSKDGKWFATANTRERSVKLWNVATGAERREMADGIGGAATLVFSPDGETLVSGNYDNDVRVWKTGSGELVKKMEDLTGAMFAAEFTPDGKWLVMAGLDETVYVWDARTFALVKKLGGHGETIAALTIAPDGRTLVTGGFDVLAIANPVKVVFWDLAEGKALRTVRAPHRVASLAFSPDSKWLAMTAGQKEIEVWRSG